MRPRLLRSYNLTNEDSYVLQGYKTILPKIKCGENLVRIICLVKECILPLIKIRRDLMSEDFPSIWLEYQSDSKKKSTLISEFYRVWTHNGLKTIKSQVASIKIFNSQIEKAFEQKNRMNTFVVYRCALHIPTEHGTDLPISS